MRRRLPPYLKRTRHLTGPDPRVVVDGWDVARLREENGHYALFAVMPSDEQAQAFDWSAFAGLGVTVGYHGPQHTQVATDVAYELVVAGARLALAMDHTGEHQMHVYRPRQGGARV